MGRLDYNGVPVVWHDGLIVRSAESLLTALEINKGAANFDLYSFTDKEVLTGTLNYSNLVSMDFFYNTKNDTIKFTSFAPGPLKGKILENNKLLSDYANKIDYQFLEGSAYVYLAPVDKGNKNLYFSGEAITESGQKHAVLYVPLDL